MVIVEQELVTLVLVEHLEIFCHQEHIVATFIFSQNAKFVSSHDGLKNLIDERILEWVRDCTLARWLSLHLDRLLLLRHCKSQVVLDLGLNRGLRLLKLAKIGLNTLMPLSFHCCISLALMRNSGTFLRSSTIGCCSEIKLDLDGRILLRLLHDLSRRPPAPLAKLQITLVLTFVAGEKQSGLP